MKLSPLPPVFLQNAESGRLYATRRFDANCCQGDAYGKIDNDDSAPTFTTWSQQLLKATPRGKLLCRKELAHWQSKHEEPLVVKADGRSRMNYR